MPNATTTTIEPWAQSPVPWHPHNGQRKAVKFLLEHAAAGLFADPGVGKTSAVLAAFKVLKAKKLARKMLVIAPLKPTYMVWGPEASKWKDFNHFRVEILHGKDKDEALYRDADIYVINPEGLDWLLGAIKTTSANGKISMTCDVEAFRKHGFDTLVLDELTLWKHTNSGRHKALKTILHTFSRRWGLTGTPAPNGLIDLFGQVFCLDMGRSFGPYITHFRNTYFVPSYDGFGWNLQRGAEKKIYERIGPLVLRLQATDYIDMPELVEVPKLFDLPDGVRKTYDQLENYLFTMMGSNEIVAGTAAAASMKLRQVVNGALYVDDAKGLKTKKASGGRDYIDLHDEKLELLGDLVEELNGSPLLVAYDFKHDLDRLLRKFGKDTPFIGGGVTGARALEIEAEWNRGEIPLLLVHPMSAGHGLNLQRAANHVAWFGLTFNRELFDQTNGRVHRQGNKAPRVFVHFFLAKGTIDETVFFVLRDKAKTQNALLDALKIRRKSAR